jgi:hypothetical protein
MDAWERQREPGFREVLGKASFIRQEIDENQKAKVTAIRLRYEAVLSSWRAGSLKMDVAELTGLLEQMARLRTRKPVTVKRLQVNITDLRDEIRLAVGSQ